MDKTVSGWMIIIASLAVCFLTGCANGYSDPAGARQAADQIQKAIEQNEAQRRQGQMPQPVQELQGYEDDRI